MGIAGEQVSDLVLNVPIKCSVVSKTLHFSKKETHIWIQRNKTNNFWSLFMGHWSVSLGHPICNADRRMDGQMNGRTERQSLIWTRRPEDATKKHRRTN